ncbi:hypothetical protein C8R41DRAFT_138298 [Lentinula lateritia]|uniref:acireductone dioxygenase (Fe(2+)-requiring) n=1 Tax=Lentinula lateritia TaxID=40482 RepID=A0ABQ8VSD0_9AGAR|nr:hypothetical protein C8R41DRAFT_138298 [Lentinula lateritia]
MPLHAYHHDNKSGDPGHPHHSSHSVPIDYLGSLGIPITSFEGPDFEGNARKIAKDQGYPLTDNSTFIWDLHEPLNGSSPSVKHHAHQIREASRNENDFRKFIIIPDYLVAIIAGSVYLDIEDPLKQTWIRVELPAGTLLHIPAGVSRRIAAGNVKALMFLKDESDVQVLWDKEAEAHPIRQEYLRSMNVGL